MSDLGCPPGVTQGWAIPGPGRGTTAEEAVRDLLRTMTGPDWSQATQSRASIGYPEAPVQTWIVALSHGPEISVTVTTVGATFEAVPDTLCHARRQTNTSSFAAERTAAERSRMPLSERSC